MASHRPNDAETRGRGDSSSPRLPLSASPRLFAVIPAAGHSRRMGRPKLLLPLGGRTVLARLLEALRHPAVADCVVVIRPDDEPLRAEAAACGATVVQPPVAPPDMRTSVEHALADIRRRQAPRADDGWLLVPADHPLLEPAVLDRLIGHWQSGEAPILVPTCAGRRGHPTFFRWPLADAVAALPSDHGLNRLLHAAPERVTEFPVEDPAVLTDLDTPDDYESLRQRFA